MNIPSIPRFKKPISTLPSGWMKWDGKNGFSNYCHVRQLLQMCVRGNGMNMACISSMLSWALHVISLSHSRSDGGQRGRVKKEWTQKGIMHKMHMNWIYAGSLLIYPSLSLSLSSAGIISPSQSGDCTIWNTRCPNQRLVLWPAWPLFLMGAPKLSSWRVSCDQRSPTVSQWQEAPFFLCHSTPGCQYGMCVCVCVLQFTCSVLSWGAVLPACWEKVLLVLYLLSTFSPQVPEWSLAEGKINQPSGLWVEGGNSIGHMGGGREGEKKKREP